jgi:RsiW-degrading membrane proteinase PrsW (M82 family)
VSRTSPFLPALVVLVVALVVGFAADRYVDRDRRREDVADVLQRNGRARSAEEAYFALLQAEPTNVQRLVAFLDAHHAVEHPQKPDDAEEEQRYKFGQRERAAVSDQEIDGFLASSDLPTHVVAFGHFWRAVLARSVPSDVRAIVVGFADADPPVPWANRLLAREALRDDDLHTAAVRFLREGRHVPEHAGDLDYGIHLLAEAGEWATLGAALEDAEVARATDPATKARWAVEVGRYREALVWIAQATFRKPDWGPLALAVVAALAWGVFCAKLGKWRERPAFRAALFGAAFVLGTFSVVVTDVLIVFEEAKLRLVETGEPVRDALFFTFGVGLREELSKLLLFLPLLPIVRRHGTKLDVLVCGAFVGLGFAAVENLGYLSSLDLTMGLGRFLSANFLHMAMTAILASAASDFATHGDEHAPELSRTVLLVVAMHGFYDFFISHPELGGGFLSMTVFFLLAYRFLGAVDSARGRREPGESLLRVFAVGTATVCGASFVWASILTGPGAAAMALAQGLLGSAIMLYVFAQRFRTM